MHLSLHDIEIGLLSKLPTLIGGAVAGFAGGLFKGSRTKSRKASAKHSEDTEALPRIQRILISAVNAGPWYWIARDNYMKGRQKHWQLKRAIRQQKKQIKRDEKTTGENPVPLDLDPILIETTPKISPQRVLPFPMPTGTRQSNGR